MPLGFHTFILIRPHLSFPLLSPSFYRNPKIASSPGTNTHSYEIRKMKLRCSCSLWKKDPDEDGVVEIHEPEG
ncbi:hypothetical protein HanIR_Chr11g0523121 [Helianthus annuus]|nr:hypothetical protein HanIR_Chr11g0523121 [Helianthus annuus]